MSLNLNGQEIPTSTVINFNGKPVNAIFYNGKLIWQRMTPSQGLSYELNDDGISYQVYGIGSCTDTNIIIPDTYNDLPVTRIGDYSFNGNTNIESIFIPGSIEDIEGSAFSDCSSLKSVTMSDGVKNINSNAFYNCENLSNISVPNSIISIGDYAFYRCTSLTKINLGNNLESIGNNAFTSTKLESVIIPDSVTYLGSGAFNAIETLSYVVIGNGVTYISSLLQNSSSVKTIIIGNNVETIGYGCFMGTSIESIDIPSSVKTLGSESLRNCYLLKSVDLKEGLEVIDNYAFQGSSNLTDLTIPSTVTSIGYSALDVVRNLVMKSSTPPTIQYNTLYFSVNDVTITVPKGSADAYKTAENWSTYASRIFEES